MVNHSRIGGGVAGVGPRMGGSGRLAAFGARSFGVLLRKTLHFFAARLKRGGLAPLQMM